MNGVVYDYAKDFAYAAAATVGRSLKELFTFRVLYRIATAVLLVSALVPYAALAVTAAALRVFNNPGLAQAVELQKRKFTLIVISQARESLAEPPLPLLTQCRNLPSRSTIFFGQDVAVLDKMRKIFREKHQLSVFKDVPTYKLDAIEGASPDLDDMALSGCYRFMQRYFKADVQSEDTLVRVAKEFEGGFDGKACALQNIYTKMLPEYKDLIPEYQGKSLEHVYNEFANCLKLQLPDFNNTNFNFNSLFGINVNELSRFDALASGIHWIDFPASEKSHAVVLIKREFGSYIFDPAFGLMSTKDNSLSGALLKVASFYQNPVGDCNVHKMESLVVSP